MAHKGEGGLRLLEKDYSKYRRYGKPVIEVNDVTQKDLMRLQKIAFLLFYLRPKQIFYNVFKRAGLKAGFINALAFVKSMLSKND